MKTMLMQTFGGQRKSIKVILKVAYGLYQKLRYTPDQCDPGLDSWIQHYHVGQVCGWFSSML